MIIENNHGIYASHCGLKYFCICWHFWCMMVCISIKMVICLYPLYRIVHLYSRGNRCISIYSPIWFVLTAISFTTLGMECNLPLASFLSIRSLFLMLTLCITVYADMGQNVCRKMGNIAGLTLLSLELTAFKMNLWQQLTTRMIHGS